MTATPCDILRRHKMSEPVNIETKRSHTELALHGFALFCEKGHSMKRSKFLIGDLVKQKAPNAWPFIRSGEQVTGIECRETMMVIGFNGLKPEFDEDLFEPATASVIKLKRKGQP